MTYHILIFTFLEWHTITCLKFLNIQRISILIFYFLNAAFYAAMNVLPNTCPDSSHMGQVWMGCMLRRVSMELV